MMPTNAVEALTRAKALLSDPAKWTKGSMSRVGDAKIGGFVPEGATCFCANGALLSMFDGAGVLSRTGASLWLSAARHFGFENVTAMNDAKETTHAGVMALYDVAIVLAEREQCRRALLGILVARVHGVPVPV